MGERVRVKVSGENRVYSGCYGFGNLEQVKEMGSRKFCQVGILCNKFLIFFSNPNNQVLQVCVDPFNPFEEGNSVYSITPILMQYLTLSNKERYKNRNMDLIGIIPGPNMPSSFQPYIHILVDELIELHNKGIKIEGIGNIRVMLLSCSCDYPGTISLSSLSLSLSHRHTHTQYLM